MRVNFSPGDQFFVRARPLYPETDPPKTFEGDVMFLQTWNGINEAGYVFYPITYVRDDDFPRIEGDPFVLPYDDLRFVEIGSEEEALRLFGDADATGDVLPGENVAVS